MSPDYSPTIPKSRSEWASLEWQWAQRAVGRLFHVFDYTIFEEARLDKSKRADIIVNMNKGKKVIFGIIEIKTYDKASRSLQDKAMIQACGYLSSLYQQVIHNKRWKNKSIQFFIGIVFTKDYPVTLQFSIANYRKYLPTELYDNFKIHVIADIPENFKKELFKRKLLDPGSKKLSDFFS
jgi:hypothetical protein